MDLTAEFIVAIPHKSTVEDVYDGYRIPKGSIIYPNVACVLVSLAVRGFTLNPARRHRCMLNDPSVWPEPRSFKPERFLGKLAPEQFDPKEVAFGFGRRLVPHPARSAHAATLNLTQAMSRTIPCRSDCI